jgi:hypothetical protein
MLSPEGLLSLMGASFGERELYSNSEIWRITRDSIYVYITQV